MVEETLLPIERKYETNKKSIPRQMSRDGEIPIPYLWNLLDYELLKNIQDIV